MTTMQPADIANMIHTILSATHTDRASPVYFIVAKPQWRVLWAYSNRGDSVIAERWPYDATTGTCVYTITLAFDVDEAHDLIEYDTNDQGIVVYGACCCRVCAAAQ